MRENTFETECVIAALQKLVSIANKKNPYYTDDEDPYSPEIFPYDLVCSTGGMGMNLQYRANQKEAVNTGLKIVLDWIKEEL